MVELNDEKYSFFIHRFLKRKSRFEHLESLLKQVWAEYKSLMTDEALDRQELINSMEIDSTKPVKNDG